MVELLLVVLGLCLGSFVNALVWRLHKQAHTNKKNDDYSIVHGRSMCSRCRHPLAPSDLVPVLSWLWLRGRCRYCKKPIPDTPLPELLMPVLLLISHAVWPQLFGGMTIAASVGLFALWTAILTCFVALAVYDARWFLLPDRVVAPLTVLALAFVGLRSVAAGDTYNFLWSLAGAVTLSGLFYALEYFSKGRWIGHGDVKLAVSLGLLTGGIWQALLVMFVASLLGTLYMLFAVATGLIKKGKKPLMKMMLPFGPFLLAATFIVVMWADRIQQWYMALILL